MHDVKILMLRRLFGKPQRTLYLHLYLTISSKTCVVKLALPHHASAS